MRIARGEIKSIHTAESKADGGAPGTGTAVVSVFGNIDSYGDRMVPGAFEAALAKTQIYPFVWTHQWGTPPIGVTTSAAETGEGLEVGFKLFLDEHDRAREVYAGLREKALTQFSFGFRVKSYRWVDEEIDDLEIMVREILEVELIEVGPTLIGANTSTYLADLKSGTQTRTDDLDELLARAADVHALIAEHSAGAEHAPQLQRTLAQIKTSAAPRGAQDPPAVPSGNNDEVDIDALVEVLAHLPLPTTP